MDPAANFYVCMSTKSYTLILYHLRYHCSKLTKKNSPISKGDSRVLKAEKTIFLSEYKCASLHSCFLSELGTCVQNLISTRSVEH
jgi:hypothetical protein